MGVAVLQLARGGAHVVEIPVHPLPVLGRLEVGHEPDAVGRGRRDGQVVQPIDPHDEARRTAFENLPQGGQLLAGRPRAGGEHVDPHGQVPPSQELAEAVEVGILDGGGIRPERDTPAEDEHARHRRLGGFVPL